MAKKKQKNRYSLLLEDIFVKKYRDGDERVDFERTDLELTSEALKIKFPKNLGDIIYSFKFRTPLPDSVIEKAPKGKEWVLKNVGRAQYAFVAMKQARILPDSMLIDIKIPDATPGVVQKYALSDEQALLAKLRYNRLLDIFSGATCYFLQNHLRTTVTGIGQVETDEIYVGLDKKGVHYVFPVQAKGGNDEIGVVQIEQDIMLCKEKYPALICRAIATQFMDDELIAIMEFTLDNEEVKKVDEKHYKLVPPDNVTEEDLIRYNQIVESTNI